MDDADREFRDKRRIRELSSDSDERCLVYSGQGNALRAQDYAREHDKCRINDTELGQALCPAPQPGYEGMEYHHSDMGRPPRDQRYQNIYQEYDDPERAQETMKAASREFANNARGSVDTMVCGAESDKIYRTDEQPVLLNNENVTDINGVPREELRDIYYNQGERACFKRTCEAELQRDAERLKHLEGTAEYGAMQESLQARQNAFESQFGSSAQQDRQAEAEKIAGSWRTGPEAAPEAQEDDLKH